ncbi:unnamed protein product [Owenia fusiformis]|uniref:Protein quiver n=1 Tax=Owenia fusiformis TaxID=6347 RepID=A0A8S4PVE8_OWEFU|nr:unnamed protein product [Owenia fusiformis]
MPRIRLRKLLFEFYVACEGFLGISWENMLFVQMILAVFVLISIGVGTVYQVSANTMAQNNSGTHVGINCFQCHNYDGIDIMSPGNESFTMSCSDEFTLSNTSSYTSSGKTCVTCLKIWEEVGDDGDYKITRRCSSEAMSDGCQVTGMWGQEKKCYCSTDYCNHGNQVIRDTFLVVMTTGYMMMTSYL